MKKVCYFTLYGREGASSKYRSYLFEKDLASKCEIKWFSFWNDTYVKKYMNNKKKYALKISIMYFFNLIKRYIQMLLIASRCDVVFFQKACIPKSKINLIKFLRICKCRIIFDVDDAIYLDKKDTSSYISGLCDLVIVGNSTLQEYYINYCDQVIVLPTVDDTRKYEEFYSNTYNSKVIGWIGSSSTIENLDIVIDAINELIEKNSNISFTYISDSPKEYLKKIKNSHFVKWDAETYLEEISKFTIGIMPLKINEYNSGKCGFKLVQYLNMKKPVIATDIGVNSEIVESCGILIDNSVTEWIDSFNRLLNNERIYYECISNIEKNFFGKYHYNIVLEKIYDVIGI